MMDEEFIANTLDGEKDLTSNDALTLNLEDQLQGGVIRTLDGDIVGDESAQDALNYQILLNKIDLLLDRLKLDA